MTHDTRLAQRIDVLELEMTAVKELLKTQEDCLKILQKEILHIQNTNSDFKDCLGQVVKILEELSHICEPK